VDFRQFSADRTLPFHREKLRFFLGWSRLLTFLLFFIFAGCLIVHLSPKYNTGLKSIFGEFLMPPQLVGQIPHRADNQLPEGK
jgi:hypothetical protein